MSHKYLKLIFMTFLILITTGCGNKLKIDSDAFKVTLEKEGYILTDVTNKIEEGAIKSGMVAQNKDGLYQIEFFIFEDEETAKLNYESNKNNFSYKLQKNEKGKEDESYNYSKYEQVSDGKYSCVSRIENTMVYVNVPEEYENEIKNIFKIIGY